MNYKPEGAVYRSASNQKYISSVEGLTEAMENGIILEARAAVCSSSHDLIIDLPCCQGLIPRDEGAIGIAEGKTRDIALISRVNKIVCFKVSRISADENGKTTALLSRRAAQEDCSENYISALRPGDIAEARVTHLEQFGAFVDIGCGVPSMIPIDTISVSRISHPSDRFRVGQMINAVVKANENGRICLSHKELLGTWEENASRFRAGETVPGIVRSVENYGIFVELAPNLAGLAEPKDNIRPGQNVSVYIKAMLPDKMKVKLVIVDVSTDADEPADIEYFIDSGHIDSWVYSTESSKKVIGTEFQPKNE